MKAPYSGKCVARGMSTLEILIAFSLLTLSLSSVIIVFFGHQSVAADIELNDEALSKAEASLEQARADARTDFAMVHASSSTERSASVTYTKTLSVAQTGSYTKQATSTVSWQRGGQTRSITFSTLLSNPSGPLNGQACNSTLVGDWNTAQLSGAVDVGSASSGNPVTSLAAFNKRLYITTSNTHGHNDDFYIYDLVDPANPTFVSSIDANGLTPGLNAIAVSSTTAKVYAYVANGFAPNFTTCSEGANCSQVQVIDVTAPLTPSIARNYKIPGVTGSGGQAIGNSVLYRNGYLYVGLAKTGGGAEFNILDVGAGIGSPTNPILKGSYAVGRGVNGIAVQGTTAYLTTNDSAQELIILSLSNPAAPTLRGVFNPPGSTNFGQGYSVASVGTSVYLGRNYVSNAPEFYILDVSNPALPTVIQSLDIGTASDPQSINGIVVRDTLAFLTTSSYFQIWNMATPTSPTLVKSFDVSANGSTGAASGCEGNYLYLGSYRSNNDKGVLYAVSPGP